MLRNLQIYKLLQQFPLFQGMSSNDLQHVTAHTKFDFRKYQAGSVVYKVGETCENLFLLIQGSVSIITSNDNRQLTVEEKIKAPYMPQLERLFGINRQFSNTMKAVTDINVVIIDKQEVNSLAEELLVFRLNLLNQLAYQAQRLVSRRWHQQPSGLRRRIVRFFIDHCERPAGEKVFTMTMNTLAHELNDSRLDVSKALNEMQDDSVIELRRGRIIIPALEKIV